MPNINIAMIKTGDKNHNTTSTNPSSSINNPVIIPKKIKKVLRIAPIIRDIELKTKDSIFLPNSKVPLYDDLYFLQGEK